MVDENESSAKCGQQQLRPELQRLTSWDKNRVFYERLFNELDADHNGEVDRGELTGALKAKKAPKRIINQLFSEGDTNGDGRLQLEEFIRLVENNPQIFAQWEKRMMNVISKMVPYQPPPEEDHSEYHKAIKFCPPPLLISSLTLFQITLYFLNTTTARDAKRPMQGSVAQALMFDPEHRIQIWRFLTYMFVHVDMGHLTMNMLLQILAGISLELVHGWRVLLIYVLGVAAGSGWTSIIEPSTPLAGASAGDYALITALISNIILNWQEMASPVPSLITLLLYVFCDIGKGLYDAYVLSVDTGIGVTAHISGALVGILAGLILLKNLQVLAFEQRMQTKAFILLAISGLFATFYNIYLMIIS